MNAFAAALARLHADPNGSVGAKIMVNGIVVAETRIIYAAVEKDTSGLRGHAVIAERLGVDIRRAALPDKPARGTRIVLDSGEWLTVEECRATVDGQTWRAVVSRG